MSNCFSCGKTFKGSVNDLLLLYKQEYLSSGVERYFYRTSTYSDIYIVKKSSFSSIFESVIKPNFNNGSEYAHIREYATKQ